MKSIILHNFEVGNAMKNDVIQIRRPVKPQPPEWIERFGYTCFTPKGSISGRGIYGDEGPAEQFFKCPFGEVGNPLWVKETFTRIYDYCIHDELPGSPKEEWDIGICYKVDGQCICGQESKGTCSECDNAKPGCGRLDYWKSSVHMPQRVSRLVIVPEKIWIEKVQDITEDGAEKEGIDPEFEMSVEEFYNKKISPNSTYRIGFKHLWDSIYAKKGFGWEENLPVWVGKFRVAERK